VLANDLPGAGCTEDDVLAATAAFAPAIELIDTRITNWQVKLYDTIAANASSAGWVLGKARRCDFTFAGREHSVSVGFQGMAVERFDRN